MRKHLNPSIILSSIAIIMACSGTSYAATKLAANSVTSREVKNGSIKSADLAVSAKPTKSNRLFRAAVADTVTDVVGTDQVLAALSGAVKGQKGDTGAAGTVGATGATGATGAQGPAGAVITSPNARHTAPVAVGSQGFEDLTVQCPTGSAPIGGIGTPSGGATVAISERSGNGWHVRIIGGQQGGSGIATVFCA
jgi:hypothetical protein